MKISILTLSFFCLIGLVLTSPKGQAAELTSYPQIILDIMNLVPRWKPGFEFTAACKASLNSKILNPDLCLASAKLNIFDSFRSKLFFDFDAENKFEFQKIDFQMNKNLKVRGLIGLHENQMRPLVIFRMGVHGNRDEFMAERYLIKILFVDLGYHVLMLENLTSHGFISENEKITFGGLEEGLHTFFILNQIKNKEFSWVSQISKIHLMALSMGGAGAFLAAYLDEQTNQQISSVQVLCPLINLQKNFARMSEPSFANIAGDYWNKLRLKAISIKYPEIENINLWPMLLDQKPRYVPALLNIFENKNQQPVLKISDFEQRFPNLNFPLSLKKHILNSKSFIELNEFWPVITNTKTPIQIVTTKDDQIVFNDLNSELIRNHKQPGQFNEVNFLDLKGFHCSLAEVYQWPYLVEMIRRGLNPSN